MADPSIVAENVTRTYPSGRGVHGLSFALHAGESLALLGANGSGKTTLTHLVTGLDRQQGGRLTVFGRPPFRAAAGLRRHWGVAQDTPAFWPELTGRDHLAFFLRQYGLRGAALAARVDELLAMGDLAAQADHPMKDYSFGMRRKAQVLAALGHDPELLILDEPSAGADAAFLSRLRGHVQDRCRRGKATYIADNDVAWLAATATRALRLVDGRMVAQGSVDEVLRADVARASFP